MSRKLVGFDWAVKRLLRNKVNFGVLEGFLSELLKDDIQIQDVLESESNKDIREQHLTRLLIQLFRAIESGGIRPKNLEIVMNGN